ncbi:ATP-binding protein [Streptomyces sp. NPDC059008]|uniref:ATP-binding protein n=1 Tax=Streptomyces sp. NPDC059008 TaxID=3346693 RepID=UPI0036B69711
MPTLVARIALAGAEEEVPAARRQVVDQVRAWGIPLDDETTDAIRLIASELITNAVVHGQGTVTIWLHYQPGRLVIEVFDGNGLAPLMGCAGSADESGRGLALVDLLAVRSGWQSVEHGKRVWAEVALPKPVPAMRVEVLRKFFMARFNLNVSTSSRWQLTLAVA